MSGKLETTHDQIAWLVANTSATNTIIRALAEANADNPAFITALTALYRHRDAHFNGSAMTDGAISEYKSAVKELVPPSVRIHLD